MIDPDLLYKCPTCDHIFEDHIQEEISTVDNDNSITHEDVIGEPITTENTAPVVEIVQQVVGACNDGSCGCDRFIPYEET